VTDLPSHFAVPFPTQICPRLNGKFGIEPTTGPPCDQEFAMSIEPPPPDRLARRDTFRDVERADNVVPLRADNEVLQANEAPPQDGELLAALSPLLDEVDGLRGDEARPQETDNVMVLLEENARLRKLAVKLSNLLGDLPERGT
jgi:hypothetical protein